MIRWVYAFIDRPAVFDAAADFWARVTKSTVSPRRGDNDEFATLQPASGDAYVKLQAVGDDHGMHLDLATEDVPALARRAVELGASTVAERETYTVLASPGGQLFCSVPWRGEAQRPGLTRLILGVTTRLDQAVIDVAPSRFEAELAFWAALTGWPAQRGVHAVVQSPPQLPIRLLVQRIGEERPTTGHLDLACSNVDLARAFHEREGATVVARFERWITMRDPAGGLYCLTSRDPVTGRLPG